MSKRASVMREAAALGIALVMVPKMKDRGKRKRLIHKAQKRVLKLWGLL